MTKFTLKDRRLQLGLTMLEVAKKVGVSEATVSRWESGDIDNMRRNRIVLLAEALELSPLEIVTMQYQKNKTYDVTQQFQKVSDENLYLQYNQLTKEEAEHLEKYRQLDENDKATVDGFITLALTSSKYKG